MHVGRYYLLNWYYICMDMPRYVPASLGFAWLINRLIYCCYRYGCEEFKLYCSPVSCCVTGWLLDIWCCTAVLNSPDTDILIIWHWYVILDTWCLTLDIWHRYLTYYYLTPDPWHSISDTGTWHVITWHMTPDIMTLTIDMLSLDTWHMLSPGTDTFDLMLWHLTGYYYTWHLYSIDIHDYHCYGDLDMIIILLPDIWYS